jgi:hypothetical protein
MFSHHFIGTPVATRQSEARPGDAARPGHAWRDLESGIAAEDA